MKQSAHFDAARFGADVQARLDAAALSFRLFHEMHPWITINTLSRAVNAKALSTANFLAVCKAFSLEPTGYFSVRNQTVPAPVSRETQAGIGAIVDRMRGAQ